MTSAVLSSSTGAPPLRASVGSLRRAAVVAEPDGFVKVRGVLRGKVGINTHFYMSGPQGGARAQLRYLAANGVTMVREPFKWDQIEPRRGQWNWRGTDNLMQFAAEAHVSVLAVLAFSAPWASSDPSGRSTQTYPPKRTTDYAAFARAVVQRYGRGGAFWRTHPEVPPFPLTAVELWNEPWGHGYWRPDPSPAAYLALARQAAAAVHAAGRGVRVLIAGDLLEARSDHRIAPWLDVLLRLDPTLPKWADALSVHAYPNPGVAGPLDTRLDPRLRFSRISLIRYVERANRVSLPIWITEVGWRTGRNRRDQVDERTQAKYLAEAVTSALVDHHVQRIFVTSWDVDTGAPDQQYGLRRRDGSTKPGWAAIRNLLAQPL